MIATESSKAKNRCTIYRESPAFFPSWKFKISFVRRTAFVLALKHPRGTKSVLTSKFSTRSTLPYPGCQRFFLGGFRRLFSTIRRARKTSGTQGNASLTKATSHRFADLLLQTFTGYNNEAMELLPCFSVFAFQICKRFFNCNF